MYATTTAHNLRLWFPELSETEIWDIIMPFATYDSNSCAHVVKNSDQEQIYLLANNIPKAKPKKK